MNYKKDFFKKSKNIFQLIILIAYKVRKAFYKKNELIKNENESIHKVIKKYLKKI